jgi:hypothetical protein
MPDGITTFGGANEISLLSNKMNSTGLIYLVFLKKKPLPESILDTMEEAERIVKLLRNAGHYAYWEEYDYLMLNSYLSCIQYKDSDIFDLSRYQSLN